MTVNIYLHFNGNCREAFEFYRSIFGGEFALVQRFGDGPPEMGVPEDERDNIMHVSYPIGSSVLMGSDVPSQFGPPLEMGSNFSISYQTRSRQETDDLFAKVSAGGTVTMPLRICFGERTSLLYRQVRHQLDVQLRAAATAATTTAAVDFRYRS